MYFRLAKEERELVQEQKRVIARLVEVRRSLERFKHHQRSYSICDSIDKSRESCPAAQIFQLKNARRSIGCLAFLLLTPISPGILTYASIL
jgi:hypothetical protein